jgi:G3E family GTPase
VSPEQVDSTQQLITQVNPAAIIYRTVNSNIDLKHIMGIDAYSARSVPPIASHHEHECHDDGCTDEQHTHRHHYEVRGISSLQITVPPLTQSTFDRLDEWVRTVLWENHLPEDPPASSQGLQILRCKGLIHMVSGSSHVLQGVRNLYEISPVEGGTDEMGVESGKLVFIGKGLDERIRSSLTNVFA